MVEYEGNTKRNPAKIDFMGKIQRIYKAKSSENISGAICKCNTKQNPAQNTF